MPSIEKMSLVSSRSPSSASSSDPPPAPYTPPPRRPSSTKSSKKSSSGRKGGVLADVPVNGENAGEKVEEGRKFERREGEGMDPLDGVPEIRGGTGVDFVGTGVKGRKKNGGKITGREERDGEGEITRGVVG